MKNWLCKTKSIDEAREIINRLVANGFHNEYGMNGSSWETSHYGFLDNRIDVMDNDYAIKLGIETLSIDHFRQLFPLPNEKEAEMKNLKPHSKEWLEFALSIGATHWHTKGNFYKIDSGNHLVICTQKGWEPSIYTPELLNDRDIFSKIDFSPLDNKPSAPEPDWSKAPEGATHWAPETDEDFAAWYKCETGFWFFALDSEGIWRPHNDVGLPSALIKRPTDNQQLTVPVVNQEFTTEKVVSSKMETTTWSGTGLPPVGICEALWNSPDEYYKVKVITHDDGEAVFRWIDGPDNGVIASSGNEVYGGLKIKEHYMFRPIQSIKSERERWIDTVLGFRKPGDYTDEQWAADLYDAGLAKLPG